MNPKRAHVQKHLTGEQTTQLNLVKNGLLAFKMILFRCFVFPLESHAVLNEQLGGFLAGKNQSKTLVVFVESEVRIFYKGYPT